MKKISTLTGHLGAINSIILLNDGKLASAGDDSTIKIYDLSTFSLLYSLNDHFARVTCLAQLPTNNFLASASFDTSIRLWDLNKKKCVLQLCEHDSWVLCLLILKDKRLVSGSGDYTIKIWNVIKGRTQITLNGHKSIINCLAQNNENENLISSSDDKSIKIWDINNGECLKTICLEGEINKFEILDNDNYVINFENNIVIKNIENNNNIIIAENIEPTSNVIFLKNKKLLLFGNSQGNLYIFDLENKKLIKEIENIHDDNIINIILNDNKNIITSSNDGLIKIWDFNIEL